MEEAAGQQASKSTSVRLPAINPAATYTGKEIKALLQGLGGQGMPEEEWTTVHSKVMLKRERAAPRQRIAAKENILRQARAKGHRKDAGSVANTTTSRTNVLSFVAVIARFWDIILLGVRPFRQI